MSSRVSIDVKRDVNHIVVPRKGIWLYKTQFLVISTITSSGYKLKSQTKDYVIVTSLHYMSKNYIYVIISRVVPLEGLFLTDELKHVVCKFELSTGLEKQ